MSEGLVGEILLPDRHYRRRAMETRGQRRWIAWFANRSGQPA